MGKRTYKQILELLEKKKIVKFGEIQKILGEVSRITTCRYLQQVPYMRSYNFNGSWYTHRNQVKFDRHGLYSHGDVHFSRDGSMTDTVKRMVRESKTGYTQRELQAILHVRVQVALLATVRKRKLCRERIGGIYVYIHCDDSIGKSQLQRRYNEITSSKKKANSILPKDSIIILILLELIRHPGAGAADIVRYLYGTSPPVTIKEIDEVFRRFDLDGIGQKKGSSIH
ncbi:MAG: hypothetical protein U9N63_08010 [Pseudomonadota bacterium]|nr:hypothetical protein [Pseudomonadota bacterium]